MKTGAIICVHGKAPEGWNEVDENDFRKQVSEFDIVRIVPSRINAFQLQWFWLDLISKGMTEVAIWMAEFNSNRRLAFRRQLCRLQIVGLN